MGFSRYVGRVGALAVVLGVGSVVVFPQTALADDGDGSGGSAATSSQESASGTTGAAGAESNVEAPTVTTPDSTTNTTATGTQDPSGDPPSSTVSAQTNTGSSTQTSAEPSTEPEPSPEPTTEPAVIEEPTGDTPVTPDTPPPAEPIGTESSTAGPTAGSDTAPTPPAKPPVSEASTPPKSTTEPAAVAPRSLQAATNATQQPDPPAETLDQRMTLTTTAALAPAAPALDPLSALLAIPVSIVTTLVNAVLTPFLGGAPAAPAQPPLLWAVLAWVRREFQRTFANSTPTAPNQNVTISLALPNAVSGPIAFGATDANGDRLTYTVPARGAVGGPTHGTVTVDQATGTFTYDPDDAYALTGGTDTFTYTVSDAGARRNIFGIPLSFSPTTATGTVAVSLKRVDVAPVINGDDRTTLEDTPVTIAVLGNDTDANGNPLTVTGVTQATHGTTTFTASGVTYTPNADYSGTDSFTYTATDGSLSGTATLTVTVTAVDDAPGAVSDTATVAEDSGTTVIDVQANDTDVDAGPKTITSVTQPTGGAATFTGTTLSYAPNANFNGTDTFTYTLSGGSTATVTVTVTAVDDSPVAVNDAATVTEDSGTTLIDVLANDFDVDSDPKTITGVTQPTNGTVTFTGTTVSYAPNANFNGTDTFTYTLNGGSTATARVTVFPVNDAPVPGNQIYTTPAGTPVTIDLYAGATDVEGDPIRWSFIGFPANGTQDLGNFSGVLKYIPNPGFTGTDTFDYLIRDSAGAGTLATVTITVTAGVPPVALNDTATVAEGGSTTVTVTTNDTDGDGTVDTNTVVITRQPKAGTATVNANGTVTYANDGSEARTDSFGYKVKDNTGLLSNEATVTITVTPVNDAPVAVNDTATVPEGGTTTIALITNDTDGDGTIDATTVVIVRQPTAGTLTVNPNGTVTYVNNGSEATADGFAYKVKDNTGALSNEATVTITITPVDDAPVAVNDSYTVAGNGTLTVNAPGLLVNDTDPDGASIRLTQIFAPGHGTLSDVLSNGTFTYRPDAGFVGIDSFTYTVSDGSATSQGTVTITVTADANNVAPVGNSDAYTIGEDTVLTVDGPGLLANDTDADGQTLTVVSIGTEPTRGSLVLNSDGSFTYTPGPNLYGTDTFTYKASDGAAETAFTTVTINVTSINDVPVVANDTIPIGKDGYFVFALANRSSDADGDTLTATLVSSTQHGTLVFLADQFAFTYQPNAGYTGTDSFTYKVNDGKVDSAVATVTLNVA
jgi:VCBS repeat-containing protein